MAAGRFTAYRWVSTAQQQAVRDFLNDSDWTLLAEFTEVESGRRADRPELAKALAACRLHRAVLVIAKLDCLSRNAAFLLNLRDAGVELVCADMPGANRLTVEVMVMALVAEDEAQIISARTQAALAATKARGKVLSGARAGGAERARRIAAKGTAAIQAKATAWSRELKPTLLELFAAGITEHRAIARALTEYGVLAARGRPWSHVQVAAQLRRLGTLAALREAA
ncbi:recombinase family protein [Belnapia sp. T6]|uniref:Recombinase family protein n=1 Tax=Belnapia mucosa TaxID=2804532 RepID=A0ABS1VCL9_9PROT|nr:recombinase family protein [Belnapia mucosa]MBL6459431.1 recombinase family protein [Belnapia mucosa]